MTYTRSHAFWDASCPGCRQDASGTCARPSSHTKTDGCRYENEPELAAPPLRFWQHIERRLALKSVRFANGIAQVLDFYASRARRRAKRLRDDALLIENFYRHGPGSRR